MKRWKKKAGAFLLCLALLLSNQNLLFTFATETGATEMQNLLETEGGAETRDNVDNADNADNADDTDSTENLGDEEKSDETEVDEAKIADPTCDNVIRAENLPEGVSVSAEVPAGAFEEPVTLQAKIVDIESDEKVMNTVAAALAKKQQAISGAYVVDISFVNENDEEREPSKAVAVTIQTDAVDIGVPAKVNVGVNTAVYHVVDDRVEKLEKGNVKLNEDNKLVEMSFVTDSFSPFAAVVLDKAVALDMGVCKIGDKEYESLDEAIKEAIASSDEQVEIVVLKDCRGSIAIPNQKNVIITGEVTESKPDVEIEKITLGTSTMLEIKDLDIMTKGQIFLNGAFASLTFTNVDLDMDGQMHQFNSAGYYCCAIGLEQKTDSLTFDNCNVSIKNYASTGSAIRWNGAANETGYAITIKNGTTLSSTNCYSGFVGTCDIVIEDSTVNVVGHRGNGSNGSYYTINNSDVLFDGNVNWGISAWRIDMTNNSTLTAINNGYSGIWTRVLNADSTCTIDVEKNGSNAGTFKQNAGIFFQGNGSYKSVIEKGAKVTIRDNAGSGIYTAQNACNMTIHSATITNNGTGVVNEQKVGATYGGGVYNVGTMVLGTDVVLYNNHATDAGDDIYNNDNSANITFYKVGADWSLDGAPDCTDVIDGWYYDGYAADENGIVTSTRWDAHSGNPYTVEYIDYDKAFSGKLALKAAHKLNVDIPDVPELPESEWDISKSKTATNLDENYRSKVTLSLPSHEEKLVSDVVFVLDKSTSPALEEKALNMLAALKKQIENTNAEVKVGVVIFNQKANATGFLNLATEYDEIENAIKQTISSGTNTHAGLLAGKAMLDSDTTVVARRKYLIFVSDGITYMYNENPTVTAWTFKADTVQNWAGPDNWNSKYGNNDAPESWIDYLQTVSKEVAAQGTMYEYPYGGTVVNSTPVDNQSNYANSIDKALYLTYLTYQSAMKAGYHCYAVQADTGKGSQYQWGPGFMDFLAGGKSVSFDSIQNEILYLVDAGSKVEDFIGYVSDDYDFDFVNDADAVSLRVGDAYYKAEKTGENQYGFKKLDGDTYAYTVTYIRGNGKDEEHFVWNINVPVKNFEPVQLTYTVKLTDPKSAAGTYGRYDENGSMNYEGLYTNNSATLYPKDSNGKDGKPQIFAKPTVSYTVTENQPPKEDEDKPEDPGSDPEPGTPSDPESETPSDPEPVTVVKQPTITTPVVPVTPAIPETPAEAETAAGAATGDDSSVAIWLVLAMAAIAAAGVIVCKKSNSGKKRRIKSN